METKTGLSRRWAVSYVIALVSVVALAFVIAVVVLRSANGGSESSVNAAPPPQAPVTGNGSSSPQWLTSGTAIAQGRQDERSKQANGKSMFPNGTIPSFGPYLTEPVDITKNGDYTLTAGPLRAEDSTNATGVGFPPDAEASFDLSGALVPGPQPGALQSEATVVVINGQRYLRVILHVKGFKQPYLGLRIWLL
jgi:hypothetical protein